MEDEEGHEEAHNGSKEVAPALLALHPLSKFVVVAVGSQLRIFNTLEKCPVPIRDSIPQSYHSDAIKAITFSTEGRLFASAGDDKLVKLWDTELWQCIKTVYASKKICATSFSHDGKWLLYADKFGVIYAVSTKAHEDQLDSRGGLCEPVQLLAHCCSIITSLKCSADGRFIVTADRDFKIRISVFPQNPLRGAHEIEGFCLGHSSFVSCVAFVGEDLATQLLVSGGGDGTVRLWEIETAKLLDTFDVTQEAGVGLGDVAPQDFTITCASVSYDGSLIAVGVESLNGVLFLKCNLKSKRLGFLQKLVLAEHFCPTSIQFDRNGWLWLVAGAAQKTDSCDQNAVSWVKVVSTSLDDNVVVEPVEPECLPGGTLLLETLDGTNSDASKALALADAANIAVKNQLSKRQYTHEHREFRKRQRNDKKLQSEA
eukprot:c32884_g1_i1 orf=234-1517(+)